MNIQPPEAMCKTNLGFVAINGTQSCEVPDKDIDSKQVSNDSFSPNVCYSTSLFVCSTVSLRRKLLNVLQVDMKKWKSMDF